MASVISMKSSCLLNFCFTSGRREVPEETWSSRRYNFIEKAVHLFRALGLSLGRLNMDIRKFNLKYRQYVVNSRGMEEVQFQQRCEKIGNPWVRSSPQSFLKEIKKKKPQKQSLHHSLLYLEKRRDLAKCTSLAAFYRRVTPLDGVGFARSHSPTPPAHSVLICNSATFPHSILPAWLLWIFSAREAAAEASASEGRLLTVAESDFHEPMEFLWLWSPGRIWVDRRGLQKECDQRPSRGV